MGDVTSLTDARWAHIFRIIDEINASLKRLEEQYAESEEDSETAGPKLTLCVSKTTETKPRAARRKAKKNPVLEGRGAS